MKKKFLAPLMALALALSLAACGGGSSPPDAPQKDVDLTAWYNELNESTLQTEDWPMQMPLEGELLDTYYPGLSEISTKVCQVSTAAISSAVGELAVVEVENAEDVSAVEAIFQARIDYQVGDENNPGAAFYPDTIESWQQTAQVVSQGNCVLLAAGGPAGAIVESFNNLFA